jgi:hypothetical protein
MSALIFHDNLIGGWDAWQSLREDDTREILKQALASLILPWGLHLMMGSPSYLVDKLEKIEPSEKGILLCGGTDVSQPDANGFYVRPRSIRPYSGEGLEFLLIDNRPPDKDAFSRIRERVEYKGDLRYVDLSSQPLLLFPYCSPLAHPRVRAAAVDEWKRQERAAAKP